MMKFLPLLTILINQVCFAIGPANYEIIDMEISNNLPFITLQVEDQKAKVLLDTGARNQVIVLDKNILAKLNTIIAFPVKEKSMDITGKEYIAQKYILPKFNIGAINFLQLRVVEDTNWGLSTGGENRFKKDGVIGLELFTDKAIIIDYPNNKLSIINGKMPTEYDTDNWHELVYKIDRDGVSIYTAIDNGQTKRFILDSGSTISLIKPNAIGSNIVNNCNISLSPDKECTSINPKNISINKLNIGELFFYIYNFPPEFEPDGILGYDFLVNKIIYIDFDKRVIKVKPI